MVNDSRDWTAPRTLYYDRKPFTHTEFYSAIVGPHLDTNRWTYTVPAGKRAYIESAHARLVRETYPTIPSTVYASISVQPAGGIGVDLVEIDGIAMFPGDGGVADSGGQIGLLDEGDTIFATTADASTGGTVQFEVCCKLTEFDR